MTDDPWGFMRSGRTTDAIQTLQDRYASDANPSHAMSLGVAYLLNSDFEPAWQHFNKYNREHPNRISTTYGMAGVAQWRLGRQHEAVTEWLTGLDCEYSDAEGGVKLLLLLFFASVASPQSVRQIDVKDKLLGKSSDARINNWPGPLALFVLGKIDEERLSVECRHRNQTEAGVREMMKSFYVATVRLHHNQLEESDRHMQRAASLSWDEYDLSKRSYLTKVWQEELHLAKASILPRGGQE
jgi:hypothetical protein